MFEMETNSLKEFEPGFEYRVSGKTITVRMYYFIKQIEGVYEDIENDGQKILAIDRFHRIGSRLMQQAMERRTPVNTCMNYCERSNVAIWDIINKDIEDVL